jgi:AcrR family transcriptional regulator
MSTTPQVIAESSAGAAGDSSFRLRLLDALTTSIGERGYRSTTISDIVSRARTSRRTFYQEFSSKEECFTELLRRANTAMINEIVSAVDADAVWTTQIRQAIDAYIRSIENEPAITLSWIRELPGLGTGARPVLRYAMEELINTLVALTSTRQMHAAGVTTVTRPMAIMLLGGLRELTAVTVEDRQSVADVTETMVEACIALLGPKQHPSSA